MLKYSRLFVNHVKTLLKPFSPSKIDYLSQQTRNTFILKRRYPVRFHKKNHKPHMLKARHFIYDLVEDTNTRKKESLDLILTQYVAGLGNAGTRISMHPTLAYETLLLPRLADYATPENIQKYIKLAMDQGDNVPFSSASVEKTMKCLSKKRISVVMSKDVPWILEKWHIRASFRKAAIIVPEDAITMPERTISGPNLDIEGKEFYVTITINNCEEVKVRCCLHHWTSAKTAPVRNEFWKIPTDPIFPEDKPILDSLPSFWVDRKIAV